MRRNCFFHFLVVFVLCTLSTITSSAKDEFVDYDYELELAKDNIASTSGQKIFKVWSFGKKELLTQEICMRNAIHGILFKGLAAADQGYQGNVKALVPDGYESHKSYFDDFFKSGAFKQFITISSRGAQSAGDVIMIAKKRFKVGLLVQVNLPALRERLEKDHIIESVKDIFKR